MLLVWALTGCGTSWTALDLDGDGASFATDCDETNPNIGPDAVEDWYNGIDENCDGNDADKDGDGFVPDFYAEAYPEAWHDFPAHLAAGDCFDDPQADLGDYAVVSGQGFTQPSAAEINPDAADPWYDGPDQDCGGEDDFDADGDGYASAFHVNRSGAVGDDCLDIESEDFPGEGFEPVYPEGCLLDENEDGVEDDLPTGIDPATVHPGAEDTFYDAIDQDCDGNDWDADGDFPEYSGNPGSSQCDDCDDTNAAIYPNTNVEIWYDGVDDNCDNNDGDMDGDGYVDRDYSANFPGWKAINPSKQNGDCWDDLTDAGTGVYTPALNGGTDLVQIEVHPGATDEPYDAIDADCGDDSDFDADQDGYDIDSLNDRSGSPAGNDCDDELSAVNVDAKEDCNTSYDDDCDGDNNDLNALNSIEYFYDGDEDGQGDKGSNPAKYCEPNTGNLFTSLNDDDCRDSDDTVYDGATELCDGQDNDCSSGGSSAGLPSDEVDNDGDKAVECTFDGGGWDGTDSTQTIVEGDDCDDADNKSYPSAPEICDGEDNQTCNTTSAGDTIHANEVDNDGDGYVECTLARTWQDSGTANSGGKDCLDSNANAFPGSAENESATSCREDADGDGYGDSSPPSGVTAGNDCDDSSATVYLNATEVVTDGIDQDCDGVDTCYTDDDKDGFGDSNTVDGIDLNCDRKSSKLANDSDDCDDTDNSVYPNASELCDGQLNDCNGTIGSGEVDNDGDQYAVCALHSGGWDGSGTVVGGSDCDDTDSTVYPTASELCDGQLNNCNSTLPVTEVDNDTDGYVECTIDSGGWDGTGSMLGDDCDDADVNDYPGATETVANGDDEDCDGFDDCYQDSDGDGEGGTTIITSNDLDCSDSGEDNLSTDCDDSDALNYTTATEICDGIDNNTCSTTTLSDANEVDNDGDGFVECTLTRAWQGSGSIQGKDCLDSNADAYPGAAFTESSTSCREDADADGYGDDAPPSGVTAGTDCNDGDNTVNPGVTDTVNDGVDNDCDSFESCYKDTDLDGEGGTSLQASADLDCLDSGEDTVNTDCDDDDDTVYTGATELCDGQINDCSTSTLPTDESDDDSDGYVECTIDSGGWDGATSKAGEDCLDTNGSAYPGAAVIDSTTDCMEDADGDDYGDDTPPSGVTAGTDCDDSSTAISPADAEIPADGIDQDCDTFDDCYEDLDGDGEGSSVVVAGNDMDCTDTSEADDNDDCDDGDADNYLSNTEVCDDQDNDCDDIADDGCYSTNSGEVIFSEFMRVSDYGDPDGEWFEVYNTTSGSINADGWEFVRGTQSFVVPPGVLTFPSEDYLVFCYTDDTLGADCDYVYGSDVNDSSSAGSTFNASWILLTTSNMYINVDGVQIDQVNMSGWAASANGESLQLTTGTLDVTDNNTEANWCDVLLTGNVNRFYNSGGVSEHGTPGVDASCEP